MSTKTKNSTKKESADFVLPNLQSGKADDGLLFVTGLFFLTLALVTVYVSHFGLAPLPKTDKADTVMMAAATLPLSESITPSNNAIISSEGESEAQKALFLASLSETPVKEIFIGSYGTIDKEILEGLRSGVEKSLGVKTTLLNPGAPIPKEEPFYDKSRGQYNSDVLIKSVEQSSAVYGHSVRFLYVVNMNMSSFFAWSPEAPWLRADKDQNAVLVSLYDLRASVSRSGEVSKKILLERAQKAALRALGVTVGFENSPSSTDPSCLMYPALTPTDLDAQKSEWCSPESEALGRVFRE